MEKRTFDIYALGPFMVWYAITSGKKTMTAWPRRLLFVGGVMTALYNAKAYQAAADKALEVMK